MSRPSLCERLGYPAESRLLIVNADDFGMCHAENAATVEGLLAGAYTSATAMVPCPWFHEAAAHARAHPEFDIGVNLTHTSEWESCRWGPVTRAAAVPSLADAHGCFFPEVEDVYRHARLDEVERETRSQIEVAVAAGIDVTHLDSHMGTLQLDARYHALYVRIAADYGLPIRMLRRERMRAMGLGAVVEQAAAAGVLAPDVLHVGGPPHVGETATYWSDVLRRLRPGVTEIYVHAGLDHPELRALGPAWAQRVADHQFFTARATREFLDALGVVRIGYRALRRAQRERPD